MATTIRGESVRANAHTLDLRRCRGEAAPKVPVAGAFVAGLLGLSLLVAVAALAPVETVSAGSPAVETTGAAAAGFARGSVEIASLAASFAQNDWLLRLFGIALCAAVAGSLLTASRREWQRLAECEHGGCAVLGESLPELRGVTAGAAGPSMQHVHAERARVMAPASIAESRLLRDLEQRLRSLRASNAELLGGAGLGIATLRGGVLR